MRTPQTLHQQHHHASQHLTLLSSKVPITNRPEKATCTAQATHGHKASKRVLASSHPGLTVQGSIRFLVPELLPSGDTNAPGRKHGNGVEVATREMRDYVFLNFCLEEKKDFLFLVSFIV